MWTSRSRHEGVPDVISIFSCEDEIPCVGDTRLAIHFEHRIVFVDLRVELFFGRWCERLAHFEASLPRQGGGVRLIMLLICGVLTFFAIIHYLYILSSLSLVWSKDKVRP